jgi:hypothetical protein
MKKRLKKVRKKMLKKVRKKTLTAGEDETNARLEWAVLLGL